MTVSNLEAHALHAFLFGVQITYYAHGFTPPKEDRDKVWDLLKSVAEGETTMVESPTDYFAEIIEHPELQEGLSKLASGMVRNERNIASQLLRIWQAVRAETGGAI